MSLRKIEIKVNMIVQFPKSQRLLHHKQKVSTSTFFNFKILNWGHIHREVRVPLWPAPKSLKFEMVEAEE